MNPNRVVIDTNVFISALLNPLGTPKKVINIAVSQFTILQSEATYQELATRISKKKFDKYLEKDDRLDFLGSISPYSCFNSPCTQSLKASISFQDTIKSGF
nr:putative toxin-antitoxin system toxin component, PIN family [Microcystis sp. M_QC_C_20170808_M2Col]